MLSLNDYKQNFRPYEIPDVLIKLLEFEHDQSDYFSSGFELVDDDKTCVKTWSENLEFLGSFFPIGQANGSGSTYAIWCRSGELASSPIVIFGDEGGIHIVAENLMELLRILTLDIEPIVDLDSFFYPEDVQERSARAADDVKWIESRYQLKPVAGAQEVMERVSLAQKRHGGEFRDWLQKYGVE